MKNKFIFVAFTILLFIIVNSFLVAKYQSGEIKGIKIAGQNIKVELALTDAEQAQGLSGRIKLAEGKGMLFVFSFPNKAPFWMKDMNFPIDIIWLAPSVSGDVSKAKIIYIKKSAKPEDYPDTYGPAEDAKYVLEVVSGFSEKNNLKVGDEVEFRY